MALINKKKFKSGVVNLLNDLKKRIANQPQAIEDFATGLANLLEKYAVGGNVIPGIDFITDTSLYYDEDTKELRANVGQATNSYIYETGDQEFILVDPPINIIYIVISDGTTTKILTDFITEWVVDVSNKKITILVPLNNGDRININYQFLISI